MGEIGSDGEDGKQREIWGGKIWERWEEREERIKKGRARKGRRRLKKKRRYFRKIGEGGKGRVAGPWLAGRSGKEISSEGKDTTREGKKKKLSAPGFWMDPPHEHPRFFYSTIFTFSLFLCTTSTNWPTSSQTVIALHSDSSIASPNFNEVFHVFLID